MNFLNNFPEGQNVISAEILNGSYVIYAGFNKLIAHCPGRIVSGVTKELKPCFIFVADIKKQGEWTQESFIMADLDNFYFITKEKYLSLMK